MRSKDNYLYYPNNWSYNSLFPRDFRYKLKVLEVMWRRAVQSREEVKVPLEKEEIDVTKEPYVKEEVSVKSQWLKHVKWMKK